MLREVVSMTTHTRVQKGLDWKVKTIVEKGVQMLLLNLWYGLALNILNLDHASPRLSLSSWVDVAIIFLHARVLVDV